jgi:hypothetical protein
MAGIGSSSGRTEARQYLTKANFPMSHHLDRRTALKWIAAATASAGFLRRGRAQSNGDSYKIIEHVSAPNAYGTDPDLMKDYRPGDLWPLTFSDHQRNTAAALCGLIIPADTDSPSASHLNVHDFIDEWISSPYASQNADRELVLFALTYLDEISQSCHGSDFALLSESQQSALCELMATTEKLSDDHVATATEPPEKLRRLQDAFRRFRELTAGGYFTTPEGIRFIGYVGNIPSVHLPEPPQEVLIKLGLE